MNESDLKEVPALRNGGWKRGLPPGKYYEGMVDDYEVYFSPGGVKWHRRRQPVTAKV